jgi:hypothetical protein
MLKQKLSFRFGVCINNDGYPASLEMHKIYRLLSDEDAAADGDIRVIDESGEDYLYPMDYFLVLALPQDSEYVLRDSFSQHVRPVAV